MKRRAAIAVAMLCGCTCGGSKFGGLTVLAVPSAQSVDFQMVCVGGSQEKPALIESAGTGGLEVMTAQVQGSSEFTIDPIQPTSIFEGKSLTINVHFAPTSSAAANATLIVTNSSTNMPTIIIALSGSGLAPPASCDDGNPCTTDSVDLTTCGCDHVPQTGSCDGGLCSLNAQCDNGQCKGSEPNCDDGNPCTTDACADTQGCIHIPNPALCDDMNPCTIDTCDVTTGCQHAQASNGTPCGPITGCTNIPICILGSCDMVNAPNGTPCNDGNVCTVNDTCEQGTCAGMPTTTPPTIQAQLTTFGNPYDQALFLGDGRLVFARSMFAAGGLLATTVQETDSGLTVLNTTTLPLASTSAFIGTALQDVVIAQQTDPTQASPTVDFTFYQVDATGSVDLEGTVTAPVQMYSSSAVLGTTLYVCDYVSKNLFVLSFADIASPTLATTFPIPQQTECVMAVDSVSNRLFLDQAGGLQAFDVSTPLAPAIIASATIAQTVNSISAENGLLAITEWPQTNSVWLYDAATLTLDATITDANNDFVVLQDGLLFTSLDFGGISIYDVSTPDTPVDVLDIPVVNNDYVYMQVGSSWLVTQNNFGSLHVFAVDMLRGSPPTVALTEVTGIAHGPLDSLVPGPLALNAQSSSSVHLVDTSNPLSPQWQAGLLLPNAAAIASLNSNTMPQLVTLSPSRVDLAKDSTNGGTLLNEWVDATNPSSTTVVGALSTPLSWMTSPDASENAYALGEDFEAPLNLSVLNFSAAPIFDYSPVTLLTLPIVPSTVTGFLYPGQMLSPDAPNNRLAVILDRRDAADNPSPWQAFMVDVSTPAAANVIGTTTSAGAEDIIAIALNGDTLLYLADSAPMFEAVAITGDTLGTLQWDETTNMFTAGPTLSLPEAGRVLEFDGRVAFIGRTVDVAVVDLTVSPPNLLGTVAMPEQPLDAAIVGDTVYVATQSTLNVVSPPCPEP